MGAHLVRCLLVGLLVAVTTWPQDARAATYEDQGAAYAAACARAEQMNNAGTNFLWHCQADPPSGNSGVYVACGGPKSSGGGCTNKEFFYYPLSKTCSTRPSKESGSFSIVGGSGTHCSSGCVYGIGGGGVAISVPGGKTYADTSGASPTGAVCYGQDAGVEGEPLLTDDCQQIGTLTQCVQPDGKHCVRSERTGAKFCWTPGETGTKRSSNEGATKAPDGASINPPPTPPKNNGQWQETGTGQVTVTSSHVSTTYNISSFTSTYGPKGSGGGPEPGSDSEGGGEGDNGDQPEWTKGDEPGREDAGDDPEVTRFGIGVGASMLDQSDLFGGGSCPALPTFTIMGFTVSGSDIPQWCTIVSIMRAVILIMGAFTALTILMGGKD